MTDSPMKRLREILEKVKKSKKLSQFLFCLCLFLFLATIVVIIVYSIKWYKGQKEQQILVEQKKTEMPVTEDEPIQILPEYRQLYDQNKDLIGWITIEDSVIDYPVMQTPEDENYYLDKDFEKKKNDNGSLIMDTDSNVGVGTIENKYQNGTPPSTNLIIHGHNMKNGQMFGGLFQYQEQDYEKEHSIISFDSLYEHRKYQVIAVFYSEVFYADQDVFKYYNFFEADSLSEFNDWYKNIKELSLYDTEVEAKFGDEFITLSTCSYHVEDGRFVVVGKRIE
ncbi:MAG: class B sortase [Lachnospiraceae bacterium]